MCKWFEYARQRNPPEDSCLWIIPGDGGFWDDGKQSFHHTLGCTWLDHPWKSREGKSPKGTFKDSPGQGFCHCPVLQIRHMSIKASFTSGPGDGHITARASPVPSAGRERPAAGTGLLQPALPSPPLPPPPSLSSAFCSLNIKDPTSLN